MADRFDKLTERARRVLTYAQEEAARLSHNYIGTEHILLGLTRDPDSIAGKVLKSAGVDLKKVRSAVETVIGRGQKGVAGQIGLTPRAKKVIELSVEEARKRKDGYIGTEHLLLGLVREGEGVAWGILESLGVTRERLRTLVSEVLGTAGTDDEGLGGFATPVQPAEEATEALAGAKNALGAMLVSPLERDLLNALVIARLEEIEAILRLPPRLLKVNLGQIDGLLPLLDELARLLEKHGRLETAAAIRTACSSLHRVLGDA